MTTTTHTYRSGLWLRWVSANAVSEMVGLGLTFGAIGLVTSRLAGPAGAGAVLISFGVAVACGAIEATVVGLAQWWALRPWLPAVTARGWWGATLAGALVAYGLGYLPSTLMSLGETASQAPVAEPPQAVLLLLAAGLGAVAGTVLALAQWRILRRYAPGAGRWLAGNAVAWTAGMPMIFRGMDVAFAQPTLLRSVLIVAGTLLAAGAVVGAIHGTVLVRLARDAAAP